MSRNYKEISSAAKELYYCQIDYIIAISQKNLEAQSLPFGLHNLVNLKEEIKRMDLFNT